MQKNRRLQRIVFAALLLVILIICAQILLPLPAIPLTLQPLGVGVIGSLLPVALAGETIIAYLILGAVGLPVFAGFAGGVAAFMTPSGGYLPSFFVYAVLVALFLHKRAKSYINVLVANCIAALVYLVLGSTWLMIPGIAGMSFKAAIWAGMIPFVIPVFVEILVYTPIVVRVNQIIERKGLFKD